MEITEEHRISRTNSHEEEKKKEITELERKLEKSLFSAYMHCSIPPTLSMLASYLLIFLDGVVISRVMGTVGLAAITYCQIAQYFIQGIAQIISTGSISILSTLTGNEQDAKYRDLVPSIVFWLNIIASFIVYIICIPAVEPVYIVSNASGLTLKYAVQYSNIMIYFCPVTFFFFTYTNALLAEGLSGWSMISNLIATAVNTPLSYVLMKYTSLGIRGAAYGTIIASSLAAMLSVGLFMSSKTVTKIRPLLVFKEWKSVKILVVKITTIGFGDGISNISFAFIISMSNYYFSNVFAADEREDGFAAIGAFLKVYSIIYAFFLGFGSLGYLPIAGYYVGQKNEVKFKELTYFVMIFLTVLLLLLSILAMSLHKQIGLIFSSNEVFLYYYKYAIIISTSTLFINSIQYVTISLGQALGMEKRLIILSVLCMIIYLPAFFTIFYFSTHSFYGVMAAYPAKDILSIITCFILFKKAVLNPGKFMDKHVDAIAENKELPTVLPSETS